MEKSKRPYSALHSQSMFCASKDTRGLSKEPQNGKNSSSNLIKKVHTTSSLGDDSWGWFVYEDQMKSVSSAYDTQRVDVIIKEDINEPLQFDMDN